MTHWRRWRKQISKMALLIGVLASGAGATDDFLTLMRKAASRREPQERIEYFSRAISAWTPEHGNALLANCYYRRGEARYERYEFAQAHPDLTRALELDPRADRAYFLRGAIHLHRARIGAADPKETRNAVQDLSEFVARQGENQEGVMALGEALTLLGKAQEALRTYDRARRLNPRDPRPHLGAARAHMARRDWNHAQESLTEADALSQGRNGEVFTERAVCLKARGDPRGALADYDRGLPMHEEHLLALTRSGAPTADLVTAQTLLGRAYYGRGGLHESFSHPDQARADYQAGCRLGYPASCRRVQALGKLKLAEPQASPSPTPISKRHFRKKHIPHPDSDPGERIYAH